MCPAALAVGLATAGALCAGTQKKAIGTVKFAQPDPGMRFAWLRGNAMNTFLILALVAAALTLVIGLAVFLGERGFRIDLRHGERRCDPRRVGGRRERDVLSAR